MFSVEQWKTLANFLRDSAKIIFGSLVVGAFVSFPERAVSWTMVVFGFVSTLVLFSLAMGAAKHIGK